MHVHVFATRRADACRRRAGGRGPRGPRDPSRRPLDRLGLPRSRSPSAGYARRCAGRAPPTRGDLRAGRASIASVGPAVAPIRRHAGDFQGRLVATEGGLTVYPVGYTQAPRARLGPWDARPARVCCGWPRLTAPGGAMAPARRPPPRHHARRAGPPERHLDHAGPPPPGHRAPGDGGRRPAGDEAGDVAGRWRHQSMLPSQAAKGGRKSGSAKRPRGSPAGPAGSSPRTLRLWRPVGACVYCASSERQHCHGRREVTMCQVPRVLSDGAVDFQKYGTPPVQNDGTP
jgi:hypothetical protein